MRVAIRADASPALGAGHVMRCLSLADALNAGGATVSFASHRLPPHLASLVASHGHAVVPVEEPRADLWPGLEATDWLVVDHYTLGAEWEAAARAKGAKVLAIDDVGRTHDCDLLLDQNFDPAPGRYDGRVPPGCRRLLGPNYALLRSEFASQRQKTAVRDGQVRRVLVFMGGMDAANVTGRVLEALAHTDSFARIAVDVVIGAQHPARDEIHAFARRRDRVQCHEQTNNMAELMASADLGIGAGGSATWERCCVGLPALALCLADNQRDLLLHGSRAGFVYVPDVSVPFHAAELTAHLNALIANSGLRNHLSTTALALVDGHGASRVAGILLADEIRMRRALANDANNLHRWRNDPVVRNSSRSTEVIGFEQHERWLAGVLATPSRHLLIGERRGEPVGVVRFDTQGECADVSIYVTPGRVGRGEGAALLHAAEAWLRRECPGVSTIKAHVKAENLASVRMFERSGYTRQSMQLEKRI